jgi:hypothetical protein
MLSHWYRILLDRTESALEQDLMLQRINQVMANHAHAAWEQRRAGGTVRERPARICARREDGILVWYLDDGALAVYRVAGGSRDPDAHLNSLPEDGRFKRVLNSRYYELE